MKKIFLLFLLSLSAFCQERTLQVVPDTVTRPRPNLYGLAARNNTLYLVPRTGNMIKLLKETFPGSAYITILGTVATGVWNATLISVSKGGTGASTASGARTNLGLVIGTDVLAPNGSAASLTGFPTFNQNTTGSAATLTTSRTIFGNAFNGSADLSGIIASDYGGTGNGFTKFSGAATSEKTYNLPNASATILTDNAAVTLLQGGTGATTAAGARTNLGLGTLATQNGTFSGTSSGTNTGDQTITLTGDATGSGGGSFAVTIANGVVSLTKLANVATGTLFYRKTAGTGAPEVQTLATLKTDLGLTGTNSGDQTITLTGDITGSGTGSFSTSIANNSVSLGDMAQITTNSILGRVTASTGNVEVLTAANVKSILSLGSVENTALSTWAGSANLVTLGTITAGTWTGTVIGNAYIATALTGKTYNGLTVTTSTGTLTVANSKTATVSNTLTFTGTDGSTLNIGAGGTLNSLAFLATVNNSNWSGTALSVANGGTGTTTTQGAMNAFAGAVTSGSYLRGNGTNVVMSAIQVGDVPTLNQSTTGSAATLTTSRTIYGNAFNGSANLSGIIASTYGGTGNGFTKFSGPTTSERVFNLPDATNVTILTNLNTVTIPQGGTGLTSYTIGDLLYASASNALSKLAGVATGNSLLSGGVGTAAFWGKIGLTTHVSGTLPIANGGTGSTSTAYASLTSNVSGILPTANGGTGSASGVGFLSGLTSGYIPRATGSTSIANGIIQDNGSQIGVGGNPNASYKAMINGGIELYPNGSSVGIYFNGTSAFRGTASIFFDGGISGAGDTYFRAGSGYVNAMTVLNNGKVLVGSGITDSGSGAKLQVSGGFQLVAGSAPSSPAEGTMYYNTSTKKSYTWDGTAWQAHY